MESGFGALCPFFLTDFMFLRLRNATVFDHWSRALRRNIQTRGIIECFQIICRGKTPFGEFNIKVKFCEPYTDLL